MTSPFDLAGAAELPVNLTGGCRGGVSLLEFFAVSETAHPAGKDRDVAATAGGEAESAASERALQTRAMIDAAREDATAEARRSFEWEMETRLAQERARVERVCGQFAKDRERYFASAEAHVVRLALATARRVLSREVEADAMHLTATVRAALARVQDGSTPVLKVRTDETSLWQAMFSGCGDSRVEVVADDGLSVGECVLDTRVGRVELGVEGQMREIERGFGELLNRQGESIRKDGAA